MDNIDTLHAYLTKRKHDCFVLYFCMSDYARSIGNKQ